MKHLSRKTFRVYIANAKYRKALALLLYVKNASTSSTITNFTYNKLHELTGMHPNTLKKYMKVLDNMGFIERFGENNQHVMFNKIRAKKSNICIERINYETVKSVELGLLAMFIVEKQNQKEFIKRMIVKKETARRNVKQIVKVCNHYGYTKFNDYGISYKYIAKSLGITLKKVSSLIKEAIKRNMIIKYKHSIQLEFVGQNAHKILKYCGDNNKNMFATKNNIYKVLANTYSIPCEWDAYTLVQY